MAILSWREMSEDSVKAARLLLQDGKYRSCVSRAYYAAYCAATEEIRKRVTTFPYGRNNPPHDKVSWLIQHNTGLAQEQKDNIKDLIQLLLIYREDADYRPNEDTSHELAEQCLRDAMQIQNDLWGYAR